MMDAEVSEQCLIFKLCTMTSRRRRTSNVITVEVSTILIRYCSEGASVHDNVGFPY